MSLHIPAIISNDPRLRAFNNTVAEMLNGMIDTNVVKQTADSWILAPWIYVTADTVNTTNATPTSIVTIPMAASKT